MSERIIIRNFAGIKEIDLELRQINVLIGPQATGKSITAKTIYFFKAFLNDLFTAIEGDLNKRKLDADFLKTFTTYFPVHALEETPFLLRYEANDTFIQVEQVKGKPKLSYSDYYNKEFNLWKSQLRSRLEEAKNSTKISSRFDTIRNVRRSFALNQAKRLGRTAAYGQVFIPAGRSFFAILQSSIFTFLSSNNALDPFLAEFGAFYENTKLSRRVSPLREDDKRLKIIIDNLIESILQGKHVLEKGKDYLITVDGRKISLANSSSGQQEMLPLALILSNIAFVRRFEIIGNVVYIEEPEAHLFPSAQKDIVDLVATIYNRSRSPVQFVITTHSPYILTAFNNLLQAGNLQSTLSEEELPKLEQVVPTERQLKYEQVRVYSLNHGSCESIIAEDTGLITTSIIDEVSDQLAIQFDQLLDIS
jgi:AAA15 family ATPase/GTPase